MGNRRLLPLVVISLFLVMFLGPHIPNQELQVRAAPNSPYQGSGNSLDVHEFARNEFGTFTGQNGTSFSYGSGLYPSGYRGYRLQTNVSQVYRYTDPLPNGSFENITSFDTDWILTNLNENLQPTSDGLIEDISPVTGQNPTHGSYVMDMDLRDKKFNKERTSYVDNDFNYTSEFLPDTITVKFDVRLSGDIIDKDWLVLRVSIWNQGSEKGIWERDLKTLKEEISDQWGAQEFSVSPINGQIRLRIKFSKETAQNEDVRGHIYFDHFQLIVGSQIKPSEANLRLNNQPFVDQAGGASGTVDVYADTRRRDEALWANCWSTTQNFQFTSPTFDNITFYYDYHMHVKHIDSGGASTSFSIPVDGTPTWITTYTVGSGAPSGHVGYSFGVNLRVEWTRIEVNNSLGQSITHSYNTTSNFVKLKGGIATPGETYTIYASAFNYVQSLFLQKAPSQVGPWSNISSGGYYVKGDYIRVLASLRPIGSSNNYANVTIFFPNDTLWETAESPTDVTINDVADTLTSQAWQIPDISDADIGESWQLTVAFDNLTQCGMRQALFAVVVEAKVEPQAPADGKRVIWGQTVLVNVTAQNNDTLTYITDGSANIRYIDRNLQVQYVSMASNEQGAYSTFLSTNLMTPNQNAEIAIEFFKQGFLNASYAEGTHVAITINLVNDIETEMLKPSQETSPNVYTAETSETQGYTIQVKFWDSYQNAYVLDGGAFWPTVTVAFDRYNDGSFEGSGTFTQNSTTRIFNKHDTSYSGITDNVTYIVTMRVEDAGWEYEQQNFTVVIKIVSWATNLDALRTIILFPPSGDGWTVFDQSSDDYEVHIYWLETFNLTVFYQNISTSQGIPAATVQYRLGVTTSSLNPGLPGYYSRTIDTTSLSIGLHDLYVDASYPGHAAQTILVKLNVEVRRTVLSNNQTGTTFELAWGDSFVVNFTYLDRVDDLNRLPLNGATVTITGYVASHSSYIDTLDGNYIIKLTGDVPETTYIVAFRFNITGYRFRTETFTIIVRPRHTQALGFLDAVSVPWGDDVLITLFFNDTDLAFQGIPGGTIIFTWFDNLLGTDYWLTDNGDGSYTIILNTTKVPVGTQGYNLIFQVNLTHYDTAQVLISFQVRDIGSTLYNIGLLEPYGTSVPWGDSLTIILQYNDTDHGNQLILGATLSCDWDFFYWSFSYNTTYNAYLLRIDTSSRSEGSYTIHITANLVHHQNGVNVQSFVLRTIQTTASATPSYIPNHPMGDNLTITITYQDIDHGGVYIPFAAVSTDWNATYFTFYTLGNGTYLLELNTSCRVRGTHQLLISLSATHYAPLTIPVTLILERTPLYVDVLDPTGGQISVQYGDDVFIRVNVSDHHGQPVDDATTVFRWGGHSPVTMTYLGNGIFTYTFAANETPQSYIVTIEAANESRYLLGVGTFLLFIELTGTDLTVITPVVQSVIGGTFTISVNFTTDTGLPIDGANVTYSWADRFGTCVQVAPGIYNATIDSTGLGSGQYNMYVSASKPTMLDQSRSILVNLMVIPTRLETQTPVFNPYWGDTLDIIVNFTDTYNHLPIDGADIRYDWGNLNGSLQPMGIPGFYNISLPTNIYAAGSVYTITLSVDYAGYQVQILHITVNLLQQPTTLELVQAEAYYPDTDTTRTLNGTSWTIPWGDILILSFNYTDSSGNPVIGATGVYNWGLGTGTLEYLGGLYVATINLTGVTPDYYPLSISVSRQNYVTGYVPAYDLQVTQIITLIEIIQGPASVSTGTLFSIVVNLTDTFHGLPVTDATVYITVQSLGLQQMEMNNNGDGTYSYDLSIPLQGEHLVLIHAIGDPRYIFYDNQLTVVATLHPAVQTGIQIGAIAAVIGIIVIAVWFAYVRVFSIPWTVRKMRKMSKTIRKGNVPTLSKTDIARLSDRSSLMTDIVSPSYRTIGMAAGSTAIPTVIDWHEREVEEAAIWDQLKSLPLIEYEQKLELFQEMKKIAPSERVWFIEDLRKQMADGTRFKRKIKAPELAADVEEELQNRLEAFPALSIPEKQRIAAQLRQLPPEEWDEIFHTLAVSESKPVPQVEVLRPDEFPSLSAEERNKILAELEGLNDKEREKVLQTLREKHAEKPTDEKLVKGKKKFVIDDEDDAN